MGRRANEGNRGLSLAVIVPDLGRAGGAERLALQCVRRWQTRHRVTLYSRAFDETLLERHGVEIEVERRLLSVWLGRDRPTHYERRILDAVVQPRAWSRELGDHDVYLAHQWPTHRIERRPLVWYAHELHRLSRDLLRDHPDRIVAGELRDLWERNDLVPADLRFDVVTEVLQELDRDASPNRVVANSRLTAGQLAEALGRSDVDVVYPGVDPSEFLEPTFDDPYFVCVGSLDGHKRQRLAIEAISLVEDARLVLAGTGPEHQRLERMIAVLGVQDRVTLQKDLDDAELLRLYAGARGILFTPVREPFGMVALEALAAGKPLVAVDEGGFTECVDASCAMLVPPEPAALAEAIRALVASPENARRMGQAGRKIAEGFSWDRTASELEAILLEAHAASLRQASAPRRAGTRPAPDAPEIGVRLLCDYGEGLGYGAWRRAPRTSAMPRAGYYASHHEATIRRQLSEIDRCGFDFVSLVLPLDEWRLSARGAGTLRNLLALAPEIGARTRFCVELLLDMPTREGLASALDWVAARLRDNEDRLVLHDGKPLLLLRPGPNLAGIPTELLQHAALSVRMAPAPEAAGPFRLVTAEAGTDWPEALRACLRTTPAPELVIVDGWNEHATGHALEPTVRDDDARLEEARTALAALRSG